VAEAAEKIPPGGTEMGGDPPWDAWRPAEITRRLSAVTAPWCVAAGWALDLFRGEQTREHEDLEIAVPGTAAGFGAVRQALAGYTFEVVGSGKSWPLDGPAFDVMWQTWVSEPGTGVYRLDIFREPQRDGAWVCRRDETISMPYEQIIRRTEAGVPYLVPEIVLLFKAKHSRPKDQADFAGALPLLTPEATSWLRWALERVHPGHAWISALS
jgi:hypothetical protein